MPTVSIPEMPKIGKVDASEMQTYWHRFFSDGRYRKNLMKRIMKGQAAHMEILLHHMVYGKPKENVALQLPGDASIVLIIGGEKKLEVTMGADGMIERRVIDGEAKALTEGDVVLEPQTSKAAS